MMRIWHRDSPQKPLQKKRLSSKELQLRVKRRKTRWGRLHSPHQSRRIWCLQRFTRSDAFVIWWRLFPFSPPAKRRHSDAIFNLFPAGVSTCTSWKWAFVLLFFGKPTNWSQGSSEHVVRPLERAARRIISSNKTFQQDEHETSSFGDNGSRKWRRWIEFCKRKLNESV